MFAPSSLFFLVVLMALAGYLAVFILRLTSKVALFFAVYNRTQSERRAAINVSKSIILWFVYTLMFGFQSVFAQATADRIYHNILSLEKLRDVYVIVHTDKMIAGKAGLDFSFGVPDHLLQEIISENKKLKDLAEQGDIQARYLIGMLDYSKGEKFSQGRNMSYSDKQSIDIYFKNAYESFRIASNTGYPLSMYMLGSMHANGLGTYQSNYVAIEWYSKAGKVFLRENNRELALKSLEEINKLDSNHILAKELNELLFGNSGKDMRRK